MFSLFYGLWKYIFSKTEFHVLILGIDKAGKTVILFPLDSLSLVISSYFSIHHSRLTNFLLQTLLEKLKSLFSNLEGLSPDRIVPTVGLNIGRLEVLNAKLVFWDLGGQVCIMSKGLVI